MNVIRKWHVTATTIRSVTAIDATVEVKDEPGFTDVYQFANEQVYQDWLAYRRRKENDNDDASRLRD